MVVVVANAWHHRTDAFSSVVALVGIGGSSLGFPLLDPVAGALVAGMVIKAGGSLAWDSIQDLTDRQRTSDVAIVDGVVGIGKEMASQEGSGVIDVHDVKIRRLGHYIILDMHLFVDARLSVTAGYWEKNRIKRKIHRRYPNVSEIFVHVQAHPSRCKQTIARSLSFANPIQPQRHVFQKTARSHFEIEKDVKMVISECREKEPVILELTHCLVHYDMNDQVATKITVEVNLKMDRDITLLRAEKAAAIAREQLLEAIPDITAVDLHVELLD